MENKLEELKKENETIETKCKSTEETLSKYKDQTREILRKSKEKITDTVKEKTELAEKLKNTETELETLKESGNAGIFFMFVCFLLFYPKYFCRLIKGQQ